MLHHPSNEQPRFRIDRLVNRDGCWSPGDEEPPGGWAVHNAERWRIFLAWFFDWVVPYFICMKLGNIGGDLLIFYWIGNSAIRQGMGGKGQSPGKQMMGIRLCYVTQKYDELSAYFCEVTVMRSCVRFALHAVDLILCPYAILIRPWVRYDHRLLSDSLTSCTLIRDRRIHVFTIEEMRNQRKAKERPWN